MKTMEQFWDEITADKELAERLISVSDGHKLGEFLKENGVDCTKEQFTEFVLAKAKTSGELSDEQLEEVSGGLDLKEFGKLLMQIFGGLFC
ncbi:MAG: Nif11-like leader peptide family RiPP precursor [Ruminiclostridium sp.]